ncbi:SRPBCC family protein [Calidifontibacter sp. DB0510]|uniref:SRPBCC family protein n=1 Tax=Metallococcus carri TaxID=1656884 RepID=A0A967E930_9MICO|nr:SRPBCC family protein [Metallococcus carri]NHN55907.1 SRPBCC family protein [Metallococcus carri]NOP38405.1 SRPBCC family protein [Calidifontibacter sp. DB2511S]
MPQVEREVTVAVEPEVAFAVSQTTGEVRLRWDPFIRQQYLMDGAARPGKGVRTFTRSRHGLSMVSEYVSYNPPRNVGMTMRRGPWFFATFGGGWRFTPVEGGTRAVWKYTFAIRPKWLAPIADPIGIWLLGKDIRRRIDAFAAACGDPQIVAAAST